MPSAPRERKLSTDPNDPELAPFMSTLDLRDAMLAGIASGVNDLVDAARSLDESARTSRLEKILLAAFLIFNAGAAVALILLAISNHSLGSDVRSCTTPGGDCYQRAQAQTAQAVATLNAASLRIMVVAVECERSTSGIPANQQEAAFEKCVNDRAAVSP
jgi:hypothetical protein